MSDYALYPVAADVEALLTKSGITVPTGFDTASYALAAIDELEQTTRWRPFLAGASSDFSFDPPGPNLVGEMRGGGRRLLLDRGFTSITAVHTGVTPSSPTGNLLVLGTDYRLRPYNAAHDSEPYTEIEFTAYQYGPPSSVKVTGTPGFTATLRAEVWAAVRDLAASRCANALREAAFGDNVDEEEMDIHERKSIELLQKWGDTWRGNAIRTIMRYVRADY